jgi:hypothetical protein
MNAIGSGVVVAVVLSCGIVHAAAPPSQAQPQSRPPATTATGAAAPSPDLPTEVLEAAWYHEMSYRHRLARLNRLREIAQERGDTERVARIDALYETLEARHAERVERFRGRLGDEQRLQLEERLASGREHKEWMKARREAMRKRADLRAGAREDAAEIRQEWRRHRAEQIDKARDHRADQLDKARDHRAEQLDKARDHRADQLDKARDHRAERMDKAPDHRSGMVEKTRDVRAETFAGAREARSEHRAGVRGDQAAQREAVRDHHAAIRQRQDDHREAVREHVAGVKKGSVAAEKPRGDRGAKVGYRLKSQRDVDSEVSAAISDGNADAEFEKVRGEIESEED